MRSTRQPGAMSPSPERGLEATVQPRRARLRNPIPAASSRRTRSSLHPFSPNERSTAGSAMPAPSSAKVTDRTPGVSSEASMVTRTRVAPARRLFWSVSVNTSASPAAYILVTRLSAPSKTRARIRSGSLLLVACWLQFMAWTPWGVKTKKRPTGFRLRGDVEEVFAGAGQAPRRNSGISKSARHPRGR